MTALYIILGILLILLVLLLLPVKVCIEYDKDLRVWAGYTFLKFQLVPQKPKKHRKKKKKNKSSEETVSKSEDTKKKKKNPLLEYKDKHGLDGLIDLIKLILYIVGKVLCRTARHMTISYIEINAYIGGEDSADAAMKYGYACSVIYPALSFLQSQCKLKKFKEDVSANFFSSDTAVELKLRAKMSMIWVLWILIAAACKFIFSIAKNE